MSDYEDMPYFQLKAECKKQGLDSTGKKPELLARLGVTRTAVPENAPEPTLVDKLPTPNPEPHIVQATKEELEKFLPDAKFVPTIDCTRYEPWLTTERLEKLAARIEPIAAGKGKYRFDLDRVNGAFQVEFSGKGPLLESTTLIDTDDQIVRRAQQYFNSRLVIGKNNQSSVIH
jgi:hypothetical protein